MRPQKPRSSDPRAALERALALLAKREYGRRELALRLLRGFTPEAVDEAVGRCVAEGWQSEERFLEMLVRHAHFAGQGPRKLSFDAVRKGVDPGLVREAVAAEDWAVAAAEALGRLLPGDGEPTREQRERALAALQRRGFTAEQCLRAIEGRRGTP
ncbi:MAG: RecX family transcriptional regulator [Succinivibrionaceae bacterium]|nr:RecX family transcriptional regulator [Succinivibrionaceae bacterium]